MTGKNHFRGMATATGWADDVAAARDWYADLFGVAAYYQQPPSGTPVYCEFRLGEDEDEFGIIDRRFAPPTIQKGTGGIILYWHVDDIEAVCSRLIEKGATELEPITKRGDSGFVTASCIDPFGNIIGVMHNPHFAEMAAALRQGA